MKLLKLVISVVLSSCTIVHTPQGYQSHEYQELIDQGVLSLHKFDQGEVRELDKAFALFEMAMDINPHLPAAHDGLGSVMYRKKDVKNARIYFQRAIDIDSTYARGYANLAYLYAEEGDTSQSEQYLRKAISLNKKDFLAQNNLGALLFNKDKKNAAESKILFLKAKQIGTVNDRIVDKNIDIAERYRKK